MTKDHYFDRQLLVTPSKEPHQLEHLDDVKVEERQCHSPDLSFGPIYESHARVTRMTFSAPTGSGHQRDA